MAARPARKTKAAKSRANDRGSNREKNRGNDALKMLTDDHSKVKKLFADFEKLKDSGSEKRKTALVEQICKELEIHTELEEKIFYPAIRREIEDDDIMDEALVEHAGAKDLVEQLKDARPGDELYAAKVTVLGEQVAHHIKEEEGEMFPKVRKAKVDIKALGEAMLKRKQALLGESGAMSRQRTATAYDSLSRSA
jgi:hemerythrin superfamily protein